MNIENLLAASQKIKEVKSDVMQIFDDFQHSKSELKPLFSYWFYDYGKIIFNLFDHEGSIIITQIKNGNGLGLLLRIVLNKAPGENVVIASIELDENKNIKSQQDVALDSINLDSFLQYLVKVVYEHI